MKKDTKTQNPVPATLSLEFLGDFATHAGEIQAQRVYLSVSTAPANASPLAPSAEGNFWILATARTDVTILHYEQQVRTVTPIDAFVRREATEKAIETEIKTMSATLEVAGLTVKRGKWTL